MSESKSFIEEKERSYRMATKVAFYIGTGLVDFKKRFQHQLNFLERKEIDYDIYHDPDLDAPSMCINGQIVAGEDLIEQELRSKLDSPV
ncbi:MAG: hypothetical protein HRF40_05395 [Nitrososphaera sp.]|jgi:hypothetical protein